MRPLRLILLLLVTLSVPMVAAAQGRAFGVVLDPAGKPIRGATVTAVNGEAFPPRVVSSTDNKGRFAMLGLRSGPWTFVAEAPGHEPQQGTAQIRASGLGPPIQFVLTRAPEPLPNALPGGIADDLAAAAALRTAGRFDDAISAYQAMQSRNPTLTAVSVVLAGLYREKAERETDTRARQLLLDRAVDSYGEALKSSAADSALVGVELGETLAAAGNVDGAARAFREVVDTNPDSPAGVEAARHLEQLGK